VIASFRSTMNMVAPVSEYNAGDKHWLLIVGDVRRCYPSFNSRS